MAYGFLLSSRIIAVLLVAMGFGGSLAAADVVVDNQTISGTAIIPSSGTVNTVELGGTALTITETANVTVQAVQSVTLKVGTWIKPGAAFAVRIANLPPTATPQSVTVSEDIARSVTLAGSDPNLSPLTFAIVTAPSKGALSGTIPNLVYTPNANANGSDSFTFKVSDGVTWSTPATVSLDIASSNDAPFFLKGDDRTVVDNAGIQSTTAWATGISAGPADESAQALTFSCTGYDAALFSAPPAISSTGTLTFTPIPGMVGSTTVSVRLQDNGGTANGGQDTSAYQNFTITIQDSIWASLPASTIYVLASETVYPDHTNQEASMLTTSYSYQWHAGTNQIARRDVTLPKVAAAENGPGVAAAATVISETYDLQGRTIWSKNADGYLHYRAYDAFSGAMTTSIVDVNTSQTQDFTGAPPFSMPTGNPVAGGLHLKTVIVPDLLGRPIKVTDPAGSVTCTVYKDAAHEVRVYPGWTGSATTGPIRVAREDWAQNYRETLTMAVAADYASGLPTGLETIGLLRSLVRERLDSNGRVAYQDVYVISGQAYATTPTIPQAGSQRTAANPGGAYETTAFTYTSRGFPLRVTRADGTIEHVITDFLGRPTARWKGTSDSGWSSTDTATFKLVADYIYDSGNPGLGLVTQERAYGDHPTSGRSIYTTQHGYDSRGRRVRTFGPDLQVTAQTLDNFGRATQVDVYSGVTQAEFAGTLPAAKRRASAKTAFDANGRAYSAQVFNVDAATGTLGNSLTTLVWFDRRGNRIKSQTGASAFTKTQYDGAGRAIDTWIGTDAAEDWEAARTAANDTVAERTRSYPDGAGNIRASVRYLRRDDTTATGQLAAATSSHRSVQAAWFDSANRPIGSADYGRDSTYIVDASGTLIGSNGVPGATMPAPNSHDDYRVSQTLYDDAGRPARRIDNLGRITETLYDLAGRPIQIVANRDATTNPVTVGVTDTDINQKTTFTTAVGGGTAVQTVTVATGSGTVDQITRYLRNDPIDAGLVTSTIYPDSSDTTVSGTNQVKRTFDRLGRLRSQVDQDRTATAGSGVAHEYAYDAAGRLFIDRFTNATALASVVDGTVQRIQYGYDERGRAASIVSYDQAGGNLVVDGNGHVTGVTTSGNPLNEVKRTWDGWGNLTSTAQAHEGLATGSPPTVGYTWDDGAVSTVARLIRQTGVAYPSASYSVTYAYPTAGTYASSGIGAALGRPDTIKMGATDIATAQYLGAGTLARMVLARAGGATIERSVGGAADGYDRFWATRAHVSGTLDGNTVRYDRGGRVVTRWASWATGRADRDEIVTYDQLDRVQTVNRAQADANGVGSSVRNWAWTLDHAGNWRSFTSDADGAGLATALVQMRSHNVANEIDADVDHANAAGNSIASSAAGLNWSDPTYNAAGAMTSIPQPGAETQARTLVWDAWGRLVVAKDSGATVWTGRYDGQHRLIRTTAGGVIRDNYLDEQGREIEVRTGGGAGTLAELYVWARSGDRLLRAATVAGGVPTWRAVLCDQQGSVTALVTDGTSTVVERYRYDVYGMRNVYNADGITVPTTPIALRYGYTGRPFDPTIGLGYYRARWYHASLGRFISRDPAGYIDGGNLYQYTRGNAIWYIDPSGLGSELWDGMINDTFVSRVMGSAYAIAQAIYAGISPMELDSELQRNHNPLQLAGKDGQPYWVKPLTETSLATASLAVAVATGGMALEVGGGAALIPTTFNVVTNTATTISGNNGKPMTLADLTNIGVATAAGNMPGALGLGKIGSLGEVKGIAINTLFAGMAGAANSGINQAMNTGGDVNMDRVAYDTVAALYANVPNSAFVGLGAGGGQPIPLDAEIVGNVWAGIVGLVWAPVSELIFGKQQ